MENREYCEVLFGKYGDVQFLMDILDTARAQSIALWMRANPQTPREQLVRLYTFIAHGSVAVIRMWIQSGMHETPEEIATFIEKVSSGSYAAL